VVALILPVIALKFLVKFVKVLNSETSAGSLAAAIVLGMVLGLVPFLTLQALLALLVVLFFRVNIAAALLGFALFKLASLPLGSFFHAVGSGLLEKESLFGFWTWMYNAPLLSLMNTNHSVTLGATLVAFFLAPLLFLLSKLLINQYRERFNEWFAQLGIVTAFRGSKLYQLYQWIDSPFGA
jgi:uncharacterized protein (TIGR03546 family)